MPKQTFISFSSEDRISGTPEDFVYEFPEKHQVDGLQKVKTVEINGMEIGHPQYMVESSENVFCLNEGLIVGDATMATPLNQFMLSTASGDTHSIVVPATMMPFTMDGVDDNGDQHFHTTEHHGIDTEVLSMCQVLVVGAQTTSHKPVLLNNIPNIVFGTNSLKIPADTNPILSLRVGEIPHGFLYIQPYAIQTLVRVLQHQLPPHYRVSYGKQDNVRHGKIVFESTDNSTFRLEHCTVTVNGRTKSVNGPHSLLSVLGMPQPFTGYATSSTDTTNTSSTEGMPPLLLAQVANGNYGNPTLFSNAVEESIHNRCLILPTQRAKEHFFVLTQFDSAFQQKVLVPNGYYTPELLVQVVNASLSGITLSLHINDTTRTMRYTFRSDDNFPFSIDFSPSDTLARTFGFYQRRHHGLAAYTSFEDISVAFLYNQQPCPGENAARSRRYPRGMYSVTGTSPNKNHFMLLTDTGNSWSIPNKEQTNNMFNNVDGKGLLTISTQNISTQQSYNFQKGDVVRITGYNEESVELKVHSGFMDETSGEGVENVRLSMLGGSGYVYPPQVYYEGTRTVAPIVPILLDGKVVDFDIPVRARVLALNGNILTLSGSGLWFGDKTQATLRVQDGSTVYTVRNAAPNSFNARYNRAYQTLFLPSNHGLPTLSRTATCELVENRPAPIHDRLTVEAPTTSTVQSMTVQYPTNPCKVVYTLTLVTPVRLPRHDEQVVVWTATQQAYRVQSQTGNTLVLEADFWPGKQNEPVIDDLGHVYAAVSMPVSMNKIYNKGGVYMGDMVLAGFDASTINCMKEHIRLYQSFSCDSSESIAITAVENNELQLSTVLDVPPSHVAVCGTKAHDGVWEVIVVEPDDPEDDNADDDAPTEPANTILKLQGATGTIELDHIPTVMVGCSGTYNFNEQIVLYQDLDAGEIFYRQDAASTQLLYEIATTVSGDARPLFRRAKNHQDNVDVQANTNVGALGFLVYVPPLVAAYGVLDDGGEAAYPALPGFLSNVEGDATPPVVFNGGALLNDTEAVPAHAQTSLMQGSIVSSKFFYNGARVEATNDRTFRIIAAYVPRTNNQTIYNNGSTFEDARVRFVLQEDVWEDDLKETTGIVQNFATINVKGFYPFDGTYDHVASFSSISEQSKNNWSLVTENTKTLNAEIEIRAGRAALSITLNPATPGVARTFDEKDGFPPFAFAWQNVSARHEDKSYQINKLAYGQQNLVFPSDVHIQERGTYSKMEDVILNGASLTLVDDLTTRIGIVNDVGYDHIRKFYMAVQYNPLGICGGKGFADRAYTVSPKLAKENGLTGVRTQSGTVTVTISPVFSIMPELLVDETDAYAFARLQLPFTNTMHPRQNIYRRLGFTTNPLLLASAYEADGTWVLDNSPFRLVQMTFDNLTERSTSTPLQVIVQDRVNGRTHIIHNVILKIVHPSSYNVRGFVPQKLELPALQNVHKVRIQMLKEDGSVYNMHGSEFTMTLAFTSEDKSH